MSQSGVLICLFRVSALSDDKINLAGFNESNKWGLVKQQVDLSLSIGVLSVMLSDTWNNNLRLPVAKTSTFSGLSLTAEVALKGYKAKHVHNFLHILIIFIQKKSPDLKIPEFILLQLFYSYNIQSNVLSITTSQ